MTDMQSFSEPATTAKPIAESNPLWFKDAIIYQIHVRAYHDANGDGIGDFQGLTEKLDYIQNLGVTAIWLLPFFKSPLRDDGYDISDYTSINPAYGTLQDFETFLREAHRRELRVITELVMNHTSDQHEWFQKSRRAKPGDKWRDFYVWSDTDERYREARIIFQDFEMSNWSWDPVAEAYYWHRFYHHQPDLNFDNPEVHEAMFGAIDFWMNMGIDGVRLDAVPYLYEREGTNCENLPETHAFLKKLRKHVDDKYSDKLLLAEANQWPEDASAYFGAGDECHMNFHFPLMPRLFMAIEREDRFPVIDILEQTPQIPDNCQWGIFLRNHDELTLEMVTDEERDYMYRAYADDPRARVNLGIRRRLAPLLRDDRRKMELMNALLLSLPGTPIIYYGDEIGMGDNIYLGDRDGVRTPMQWSDDRNAGFSRANPQRLYLPVITDAPFHYSSRNVEVEQSRPQSLLWWMRRVVGLRKQYAAMGRGSIEFLTPDNSKVLAYLRQYEDETLLIVANLSRYVQCAEIDLSRFRGLVPVELFGRTQFPPIGELPYFLTLGPYAFYWFRLKRGSKDAENLDGALPTCRISGRWDALFEGKPRARLEAALPAYLQRNRWFASKARPIQQVKLVDVLRVDEVPEAEEAAAKSARPRDGLAATRMLIARIEYLEGEPDYYLLPVVFAQENQEQNILGDRPGAGIIRLTRTDDGQTASLCDTTQESGFWQALFAAIVGGHKISGLHGRVSSVVTSALAELGAEVTGDATVHGGEQSNTSAVIGGKFILKMFRRISEGENPDLEIGRFLTEQTDLACVPRLAGGLEYYDRDGDRYTLAVLHEYIANEGDAWVYALDELGRYVERIHSEITGPPPTEILPPKPSLLALAQAPLPAAAQDVLGSFLQTCELLGERTADMHLALAQAEGKGFAAEPFTRLYQRSLYQSMRASARRVISLLRKRRSQLPEQAAAQAEWLLKHEELLLNRFHRIADIRISAQRTRCHGDFHLGQVLFTGKDFIITDFEGEPERPIGERRIKVSPLRDVAGMIRSFHYASHAALSGAQHEAWISSTQSSEVASWLAAWYLWSAASYLQSYLSHASTGHFLPQKPEELEALLEGYILEKAVYELGYELNNRPSWVPIPLEGILHSLQLNAPGEHAPSK